MKASKEIKNWFNKLRSKYALKNGVIPSAFLDIPEIESKESSNKKLAKHKRGGHEATT